MPDLQSELSKIANAWDTHEQVIRQPKEKRVNTVTYSGNATRDIFEFVKAFPGVFDQPTVVRKVTELGHKRSTVSALVTQMKRRGVVQTNNDGNLFTLETTYTPLVNPYAKAKREAKAVRKAKVAKIAKAASAGIAALTVDTVASRWDAETVLAHIGIKEAHKLFLELHSYFGGK